jgi:outer membrane immunogenic protein
MRALVLSTVAFAALAGSAFAADLPSRKEAPVYVPPVPAFSWTGFYIGGDIGASWATTTASPTWLYGGSYSYYGLSSPSLNTSGFMGGGYVGYNYQMNQNFVVGLEGDFQGTTNSKSASWVYKPAIVPFPANYNYTTTCTAKASLDWLAAINGRLGVAYDRALFYAIGGVAWAGANASLSALGVGGVERSLTVGYDWASYSLSKTLSGFDVGAGVEYAFTPNWLGRVEYRYYDFGSYNLFSPTYYSLPSYNLSTSVNTIRVGLAYLFSAPAPVVAKY